MRLVSYILTSDTGFAPNPFFRYCTLACCKPQIRRSAEPGDWIVGISRKADGNRIVYAMRGYFGDRLRNPQTHGRVDHRAVKCTPSPGRTIILDGLRAAERFRPCGWLGRIASFGIS